jgi:hypothetical protein
MAHKMRFTVVIRGRCTIGYSVNTVIAQRHFLVNSTKTNRGFSAHGAVFL